MPEPLPSREIPKEKRVKEEYKEVVETIDRREEPGVRKWENSKPVDSKKWKEKSRPTESLILEWRQNLSAQHQKLREIYRESRIIDPETGAIRKKYVFN